MSIFNHNIYDNIRTRVIVIHQGCLLLLPPQDVSAGWQVPGGGLALHESLAECAAREVLEETGLLVSISGVAFLREWVVPKYCTVPDGQDQVGFGLEVYLYAYPLSDPTALRSEHPTTAAPCWIHLDDVPELPLWPKELKALATTLRSGAAVYAVPSFVARLEDPSETPSGPIVFNLRVAPQ
jgi:8-oxo-dGTP pyrophosphatase MutT (NUDIX family)